MKEYSTSVDSSLGAEPVSSLNPEKSKVQMSNNVSVEEMANVVEGLFDLLPAIRSIRREYELALEQAASGLENSNTLQQSYQLRNRAAVPEPSESNRRSTEYIPETGADIAEPSVPITGPNMDIEDQLQAVEARIGHQGNVTDSRDKLNLAVLQKERERLKEFNYRMSEGRSIELQ